MARKRKSSKPKIDKKRLLEDITTAKPGEFCYFIDNFKKIWWGEIQKILTENDELIFQIMEEKESKFYVVLAKNCSFSEKIIKEIKSGK
tara:strand:+ start:181 stop:447 length:267 start_codon:yes stop_codon:yes gene_type:complete